MTFAFLIAPFLGQFWHSVLALLEVPWCGGASEARGGSAEARGSTAEARWIVFTHSAVEPGVGSRAGRVSARWRSVMCGGDGGGSGEQLLDRVCMEGVSRGLSDRTVDRGPGGRGRGGTGPRLRGGGPLLGAVTDLVGQRGPMLGLVIGPGLLFCLPLLSCTFPVCGTLPPRLCVLHRTWGT